MFRDAKVGDRVWSQRHGWGFIARRDNDLTYPLVCKFGDEKCTYSLEGKYVTHDKFPSLFWDEIPIVAPPKPKRMVKKTGWVNFYGVSHPCNNVHRTREDADRERADGRIACIRIEWEEEE